MGKRKLKKQKQKKKLLARRRRGAGMDIGSAADRDRISKLPDDILHHILSLLEPEDEFSAACLSKSWFNVWLTCPDGPDLTFSFYPDVDLPSKNSCKFKKFVQNTIPRFFKSELSLRSLRFKVRECYIHERKSFLRESIKFDVAKSIEFDVEKGVKILRVHGMGCSLPFTAKSLIELDLYNCYSISIDRNGTMFLLATRCGYFNNLKRLIFQHVYLRSGWEIEKLLCNTPLIEEIELCGDHLWFHELRVRNVPKLKRFKMHSLLDTGLLLFMGYRRPIEIVAPSLESFDYLGEGKLNIDGCQNLKRLLLNFSYIDLKKFNSFSNFQFLEFLEIDYCESRNSKLNISSGSLKHVRLYAPLLTAEVMIDAPNLLLLEYGGNNCNSISFRNPPKQLKVTLSLGRSRKVKGYGPLLIWFLRVRSSWMKLGNRENIYLSLHAHDMQKCFVSIKDSEELPEPEVEQLALFCCDPDQHKFLLRRFKSRTEFEGDEIDQSLIARCEDHRTYIESACFKLKWSA